MWDATTNKRVISSSMPSYSFKVVSLKLLYLWSPQVAERSAQLHEALLHCGRFQDALESLLTLAHGHGGAGGQSEASISRIQVVKAQIQEQKVWWPKCLDFVLMRISSLMWNLSFGFTTPLSSFCRDCWMTGELRWSWLRRRDGRWPT